MAEYAVDQLVISKGQDTYVLDTAGSLEPIIEAKADKVDGATNGNFAGLDANGNLVDSGHKHSDYLTEHQDISGKLDVSEKGAANGVASLDASGKVPSSQLPSYVDTNQGVQNAGKILEVNNAGNLTLIENPFTIVNGVLNVIYYKEVQE